jgi:predicted amidohydrolase
MIFTDTFYYKKMSFLTSTDIFSNWKVSLLLCLDIFYLIKTRWRN